MARALDTATDASRAAGCLARRGYDTVIRYYSRSAWKRLTQEEAVALVRAGLRLAVVYQNRQNRAADFTARTGSAAGQHAADYAANVIYQPAGSAIYFAVDFDASKAEVDRSVAPYFEAVRASLAAVEAAGGPPYRLGVYGSGRTCRMLLDSGAAEFAWLAQPTGWAEYGRFRDSGDWHLLQRAATTVCGLSCDPDETNPQRPDFGAFTLDLDELAGALPPAERLVAPAPARIGPLGRYRVIARDGLRLRAGPSTQFEVRLLLPVGTPLDVLSRNGDWALVDLNGDGAADGFCLADFLRLDAGASGSLVGTSASTPAA